VTAFFIPGIEGDTGTVENACGIMRRQIELDMGRRPSARRVSSLWTRRGSIDCITAVGVRDPLRGGTVIAIFDMGPRQPFVVWWQLELGNREAVREILGVQRVRSIGVRLVSSGKRRNVTPNVVQPVTGKNPGPSAPTIKTLTKALTRARAGDTIRLAARSDSPRSSGDPFPASGDAGPGRRDDHRRGLKTGRAPAQCGRCLATPGVGRIDPRRRSVHVQHTAERSLAGRGQRVARVALAVAPHRADQSATLGSVQLLAHSGPLAGLKLVGDVGQLRSFVAAQRPELDCIKHIH
jgi:hypothetical protein